MADETEGSVATQETPVEEKPAEKPQPTQRDISALQSKLSKAQQETANERRARQAMEERIADLEEQAELAKGLGDDEGVAQVKRQLMADRRALKKREQELEEQQATLAEAAKDTLMENLSVTYGIPREDLEGLTSLDQMRAKAADWQIENLKRQLAERATGNPAPAPEPPRAGFDTGEPRGSRNLPRDMTDEEWAAHKKRLGIQ